MGYFDIVPAMKSWNALLAIVPGLIGFKPSKECLQAWGNADKLFKRFEKKTGAHNLVDAAAKIYRTVSAALDREMGIFVKGYFSVALGSFMALPINPDPIAIDLRSGILPDLRALAVIASRGHISMDELRQAAELIKKVHKPLIALIVLHMNYCSCLRRHDVCREYIERYVSTHNSPRRAKRRGLSLFNKWHALFISDTIKQMIHYLSAARPKALTGTALLRLDFNTKDDWRMRAVMPTIKLLLKVSRHIVIISHRGRPNGFDKKFSLKGDAAKLSGLLGGKKVTFINHFRFAEIKKQVAAAPRGSIFLLDNLRFLPGEEKNDPALAKQLASLADFYVNDAFAVSHRANASVVAITKFLPNYAGIELEREIISLSKAILAPKHPVVLILGGAKASDKLGVITYFKNKADRFLLGGGCANTILWLGGMDVKKSVKDGDPKELPVLKKIAKYKSVVLPTDFVWGTVAGDTAKNTKILDVGPSTIRAFNKDIAAARTIIWSGPLGLIEKKQYAKASVAIARAIGRNRRAFSVSGGGETVMFLKQYGLDKKFSFISTGGGAMVDFLAGKKLPGIEALK